MAVVAGPRLHESARSQILTDLPAFLARDAARDPDAQLQLLSLLDALYKKTGYQNAFAEPAALAEVLASFIESRGEDAPYALFVSDGRTLGVSLRRGCLLTSHPPP